MIWAQHLDAYEAGRVPVPDPTYVAGYKQWQSFGRQVDKGQPGYMIFAPVTGRFASSKPADPESWRRLDRFEKPKPGEVVQATGERVRKAAGAILDGLPTVQLGGGDPPGLDREATAAEAGRRREASSPEQSSPARAAELARSL